MLVNCCCHSLVLIKNEKVTPAFNLFILVFIIYFELFFRFASKSYGEKDYL